jgi:hypothetical protein
MAAWEIPELAMEVFLHGKIIQLNGWFSSKPRLIAG